MKRTEVLKRYIKIMQRVIGIILSIITLFFAFSFYSELTYAVELSGNESRISVDQTELFNISNLYPGQPPVKSKQPLKIKNTSGSVIECTISSKLTEGDSRLFNILKVSINDEQGESVYSENLKDLNKKSLGTLRPSESRLYNLTLELPLNADNSYQALSTSFQFEVAAASGEFQ